MEAPAGEDIDVAVVWGGGARKTSGPDSCTHGVVLLLWRAANLGDVRVGSRTPVGLPGDDIVFINGVRKVDWRRLPTPSSETIPQLAAC